MFKRPYEGSENPRRKKKREDEAVDNLLPLPAVESLPHLEKLVLEELLERIIPPEELTGELELLSKELSQAKEKILEFEEKGMEFAERWKVKLVETPVHDRAVVNLKIPGIPPTFDKLTEGFIALKRQNLVVAVNLYDNPLVDEAMFYFADFLASNNTLTKLCLGQTALTDMGVYFLAKALAKNRSVRDLELFSNPITPIGWYFLSCALAVNPTLERLVMAGCKPVDNTFIKAFYLSAAILENSKNGGVLRSLNVHDTALEDKGAMALALALQENPPLEYLDVGSCGITSRGIREIFEALGSNSTLRALSAWRNPLQNPLGQSMEMLLNLGVLSQLNLESSGINDEAMPTVASLLKTNTTLTYLNLGANPFTELGASILAAALEVNSSLQSLVLYRSKSALVSSCLRLNTSLTLLNLGTNNIDELPSQDALVKLPGSEKIPFSWEDFWMCIQMSWLSTIFLNSNNLGDKGAKALVPVLSHNKTLTACNVASNGIGPEGIAALASALAICCLISLNLSDNQIGGAASLAKSLSGNTSLQTLDLSKTNIGRKGANNFLSLVSANTSLTKLTLPAQIPVDIAKKFGIFAQGNEKLLRNKERTLRGLCEVQIIRMRY